MGNVWVIGVSKEGRERAKSSPFIVEKWLIMSKSEKLRSSNLLKLLVLFITSLIELFDSLYNLNVVLQYKGNFIFKNMEKPKRYFLTKLKQTGRAVVEKIYRSGYHIASPWILPHSSY